MERIVAKTLNNITLFECLDNFKCSFPSANISYTLYGARDDGTVGFKMEERLVGPACAPPHSRAVL